MQIGDTVFIVCIIVFSVIVHEVMHGVAADWLGDKTARYAGRLTLNPFVHIDPIGTVILPLFFALSGSPIFFGYAKPVPYNPYNLRPGRFSEALVALAGPLSNLVIALVAAAAIRIGGAASAPAVILFYIIEANVMLCLFNLIPIPPLDGSKVLASILPRPLGRGYARFRALFERNPIGGMLLAVLLIYALGGSFGALVASLSSLIAGI